MTTQQLVERRGPFKHDLARTGRMALYGGCIFAPVAVRWYGLLARRMRLPNPKAEILARVALDQGVFAPVMICVFLSSLATMEGASAPERLNKAWWPALKANWMLWPLVQIVNFGFVPLRHRLLFANVVSIGWNCYLSWINSK